MRQRSQVKSSKDYDVEFTYHSGKANVVADALSRKSLHVSSMMIHELELLESFRDLNLKTRIKGKHMLANHIQISSGFRDLIRQAQELDVELQSMKNHQNFSIARDGTILFNKGFVFLPFQTLEVESKKKLMRVVSQYIQVPPRCIMILDKFTGGWV